MRSPGGVPNGIFTKGAMTRHNNSERNAQRATMVGNPAAQQSIRNQTSKVSGAKPGAVNNNAQPQPIIPQAQPNQQQPNQQAALPSGGPQMPSGAGQDFDPAVFLDQQIGNLVGQVKLKQFIESPRVKDAMESIRLKNLMNGSNPKYVPDSRSLFRQVVSKIGMGNGNN